MTNAPGRRATLSLDEKRSMLARLLRERLGGESKHPLSFSQRRFWFLDQVQPGCPAYHIAAGLRLSGPLVSEALERALNEVIRRHEALRTTFSAKDGEPVQVVAPEASIKLAILDVSHLPPTAREAQAHRIASEEARRPLIWRAAPCFVRICFA